MPLGSLDINYSRREHISQTAERASKPLLGRSTPGFPDTVNALGPHTLLRQYGDLCAVPGAGWTPHSLLPHHTPLLKEVSQLLGSPNSRPSSRSEKDTLSQGVDPLEPPSFPYYQKSSIDVPRKSKDLKRKKKRGGRQKGKDVELPVPEQPPRPSLLQEQRKEA